MNKMYNGLQIGKYNITYLVPKKIIERGKYYIYFYLATYYSPLVANGNISKVKGKTFVMIDYNMVMSYLSLSKTMKYQYLDKYMVFLDEVYGIKYKKRSSVMPFAVADEDHMNKFDVGKTNGKGFLYAKIYESDFLKIVNMDTRHKLNALYFLSLYRLNMKRRAHNNDKPYMYPNYLKCLYCNFYEYGFTYDTVSTTVKKLCASKIIYAVRDGQTFNVGTTKNGKPFNRQFLYITDYMSDGSHEIEIENAINLEDGKRPELGKQ